jgi:hypothetical protein
MIDYEKLKLVHELAEKKFRVFRLDIFIIEGAIKSCSGLLHYDYDLDTAVFTNFIKFAYIEQLLGALEEITKSEPKYKIGEEVFILWDGYIEEVRIVYKSSHDCYQIQSNDGSQLYRIEDEIFPTRQSLIEHQLQYWRNQLANELEQHVSSYCEPKTCRFEMPTCNSVDHCWINGNRVCCDDIKNNQPQVDIADTLITCFYPENICKKSWD